MDRERDGDFLGGVLDRDLDLSEAGALALAGERERLLDLEYDLDLVIKIAKNERNAATAFEERSRNKML